MSRRCCNCPICCSICCLDGMLAPPPLPPPPYCQKQKQNDMERRPAKKAQLQRQWRPASPVYRQTRAFLCGVLVRRSCADRLSARWCGATVWPRATALLKHAAGPCAWQVGRSSWRRLRQVSFPVNRQLILLPRDVPSKRANVPAYPYQRARSSGRQADRTAPKR